MRNAASRNTRNIGKTDWAYGYDNVSQENNAMLSGEHPKKQFVVYMQTTKWLKTSKNFQRWIWKRETVLFFPCEHIENEKMPTSQLFQGCIQV